MTKTIEERTAEFTAALQQQLTVLDKDKHEPDNMYGFTRLNIWEFKELVDEESVPRIKLPDEAEVDKDRLRSDIVDIHGYFEREIAHSQSPADAVVATVKSVFEDDAECAAVVNGLVETKLDMNEGIRYIAMCKQAVFEPVASDISASGAQAVFTLTESFELLWQMLSHRFKNADEIGKQELELTRLKLSLLQDTLVVPIGTGISHVVRTLSIVGAGILGFIFDSEYHNR